MPVGAAAPVAAPTEGTLRLVRLQQAFRGTA
jgi:hypothetical protein